MIELVEKGKRFVAENGKTYVVVPKKELDAIVHEHAELCEGFERDEDIWMGYDEMYDAVEKLTDESNLTLTSLQVKEMQETLFYLSLDDIRMYLEGFADGITDAEFVDIVETVGKEAKAERVESEYELKELLTKESRKRGLL